MIRKADIFLTRHLEAENNASPGYWNHASLYIGANQILEAQSVPNKVIVSNYNEFWNRYYQKVVLRLVADNHEHQLWIENKALEESNKLIGSPYRKIASIFNHLRRTSRGENCVSVVRKIYKNILGYDPGWKIPDDIYNSEGFEIVLYDIKEN